MRARDGTGRHCTAARPRALYPVLETVQARRQVVVNAADANRLSQRCCLEAVLTGSRATSCSCC